MPTDEQYLKAARRKFDRVKVLIPDLLKMYAPCRTPANTVTRIGGDPRGAWVPAQLWVTHEEAEAEK